MEGRVHVCAQLACTTSVCCGLWRAVCMCVHHSVCCALRRAKVRVTVHTPPCDQTRTLFGLIRKGPSSPMRCQGAYVLFTTSTAGSPSSSFSFLPFPSPFPLPFPIVPPNPCRAEGVDLRALHPLQRPTGHAAVRAPRQACDVSLRCSGVSGGVWCAVCMGRPATVLARHW